MAEQTLITRIITKHAELSAWENSTLPLKEGEIVLVKILVPQSDGTAAPTFVAKVGVDGKTFKESPWLFAKASDVYSWAKKANLDAADVPALEISKITGLQAILDAKVDNSTYSAKMSELEEAIASITSGDSGILVEAKDYAEELNSAMDNRVAVIEDDYLKGSDKEALAAATSAVDAKAEANKATIAANAADIAKNTAAIDAINNETTGILANAKEYTNTEVAKANDAAIKAQAAADKAQGEVDTLEGVVESNKNLIEGALSTETTARETADTQIREDFATADKTLETAYKAADTQIRTDFAAADSALDTKISSNIAAINAEASAREAANSQLDDRLDLVEEKLATVTNVMDFVGAGPSLPEAANKGDVYAITSGDNTGKEFVYDGTEWVEFGTTNAQDAAINELEETVGELQSTKADKSEVTTLQNTLEAANATLQRNIDTLATTVSSNKAAYDDYVTKNDTRVKDVEDKNTSQDTEISKNAAAIAGNKTVLDAIQSDYLKEADKTEVKNEIAAETSLRESADEALGTRIDNLSATVTENKSAFDTYVETNNAKVTSIDGKVTALEGTVTAIDSAYKEADAKLTKDLENLTKRVDAAEPTIASNKEAIEALQGTIDTLATKSSVDAVSNRVTTIETNYLQVKEDNQIYLGEDVIIFDCGGAE